MSELLDLFAEKELVLAQGCTEPGAVAFAVAAAAEHSRGELKKIKIKIDGFVYKNGMSTGLPGINKYYGNKTAAALGYFADKPLARKLTILADLEDKLDQALGIIERVEFEVLEEKMPVYVEAIIEADNQVCSLIKGSHDDLKKITVDGKIVYQNQSKISADQQLKNLNAQLKTMNIYQLIELVEKEFSDRQLQLLKDGLKLNSVIARAGREGVGSEVGVKYRKRTDFNELNEIAAKAADGTGARMAGAASPALASSGSGNQGIFISLVTYHSARHYFNISDKEIFKATMIAHLVGHYAKIYLGRLSALCGLFYAAAPGVLAALLYLAGKEDKIEEAINNLISDTSGVYCDGAKGSCALKSLTAAELALRHFDLIMQDLNCHLPSGFINCSLSKTFENLAAISRPSENTVNNTLFKVVEKNACEI
ncbi:MULTISPECIES: L-serine ammonia-lyase, iron-sulfur-dependent, subunit alpha [Halanaerobium]|jgi:L-cysteine desulfidase|uniref:L-cysteine desulfidase n=1 Tax=Halanaerobium saccharolyticum TaxID=43595 RepID=A0A2T5RQK0_9FIRM|nr:MULTISPECIES: L-serine ammonia-lyase, iron-sulfur-dependent, subunit alpha [Halanaerobium]PTW02227.1 L-cysteine desulfidase [Halanaerobium saccharolyticum]RCW62226.1 L-cysteine desulfidase [Halanaerobium sp. ST460_2HS_T2]